MTDLRETAYLNSRLFGVDVPWPSNMIGVTLTESGMVAARVALWRVADERKMRCVRELVTPYFYLRSGGPSIRIDWILEPA